MNAESQRGYVYGFRYSPSAPVQRIQLDSLLDALSLAFWRTHADDHIPLGIRATNGEYLIRHSGLMQLVAELAPLTPHGRRIELQARLATAAAELLGKSAG